MQGYVLRDSPNPYLAALAISAGPNIVGHILGPLLTAMGFWWAGRRGDGNQNAPMKAVSS